MAYAIGGDSSPSLLDEFERHHQRMDRHVLPAVERDPVARGADLRKWREFLWDATLGPSVRNGSRMNNRLVHDVLWPAVVADERVADCVVAMESGRGLPGALVQEVERAIAAYELLVPRSADAAAAFDRHHALERVQELRPNEPGNRGLRAGAIAEVLATEGVRHPDGLPWTEASVHALSPELFPGRPSRAAVRRSHGQTPIRNSETSPAPFPVMFRRRASEHAKEGIGSQVLRLMRARGAAGVRGTAELASLLERRKEDVGPVVERLLAGEAPSLVRVRTGGRGRGEVLFVADRRVLRDARAAALREGRATLAANIEAAIG